MNVFTVTYDQFSVPLLNKSINLFLWVFMSQEEQDSVSLLKHNKNMNHINMMFITSPLIFSFLCSSESVFVF